MKIPVIRGIIDRRILVNYRIDPDVMARSLPAPFRPKVVNGSAVGGICLIRMKQLRPKFVPLPWGIGSENAAHRIAVEWETAGAVQEGVYIPRRDTDSRLNALAGGRLFPGVHHRATFGVAETVERLSVSMRSDDGSTAMMIAGHVTDEFPGTSVFASLAAASDFFEAGSLGYSATIQDGRFDGLELRCQNWQVAPLDITEVASSFFDDASRFPHGSVAFDCALLMRGIEHEWHGCDDLCCAAGEAAVVGG